MSTEGLDTDDTGRIEREQRAEQEDQMLDMLGFVTENADDPDVDVEGALKTAIDLTSR